MSNRAKILIRTGHVEHLGYYAIKAYLPAKTKMNCASMPVKNTNNENRSWQIIHRAFDESEHEEQVEELINSGEYEKE